MWATNVLDRAGLRCLHQAAKRLHLLLASALCAASASWLSTLRRVHAPHSTKGQPKQLRLT